MIPWLFGDEYIYISKARNIKYGIDVIADASLGHSYPPLYSYFLSLVIGNDPYITYKNIQILNFIFSQIIILICLFLINKFLKIWRENKLKLRKYERFLYGFNQLIIIKNGKK